MIFRNRTLKAGTALTVLITFGWMASGGNAWAESRAAQRDPVRALARLADNPNLHLSAEGRESLRIAAKMAAPLQEAEPARFAASPGAKDPASEMREIASELDRIKSFHGFGAASSKVTLERTAEDIFHLRQRLEASHKKVLREFAEAESLLRTARLSGVIVERHSAARAAYMVNIQSVFQDMEVASKGQSGEEILAALGSAADLLGKSTDERPDQPFDPAQMPFRRAVSIERGPLSTNEKAGSFGPVITPTGIAEPFVAPGPGELVPNEDAQITPEIQALAASLGNQPLRIYNWVRDNIEYVPTYGSAQGSQLTLVAKRGNAFDTSSLLISLLRAAGISSRYVTGTIEVPAAAMMNWVGGAASPEIAGRLLAQGGVPSVGLTSGGIVTHIRIEHVWVEAAIDNIPSRGAVHRQGDTWVPMDPSFKLHAFTPRSGVFTENPISTIIDPNDHLFDVDEPLGRVTNVDDQALQDKLVEWMWRSADYIMDHHGVASAIDDVLGRKIILQEKIGVFASSLPYKVIAYRAGVGTLPSSLRHSLTLKGFSSEIARALGGESFSVKLSFPEINSRRLSLQFEPATQADADTLEAARNSGASSLPVYLIDVVPVIKLDGVERGRGDRVRMGSVYSVDVVLQAPTRNNTVPFKVVAGDEIVVGLTGNGITQEVIEKRFATNPVDSPSEHLHQVQLHYWMESDFLGEAAAKGHNVHMLRLPSVGLFSSPLQTSYIFGAPRSGFYQGRTMDVRQSLLGAAGEDPAKVVSFMKQAGFFGSYLEGAVFDQLTDRPDPTITGISAVRLIDSAMALDIPIYRITSANADAALPLLSLSSAVKQDIATAVGKGMTVLTMERNLDVGPWAGAGYIIQNETTGAGAYMISGGLAGGASYECDKELGPRLVVHGSLLFRILFALFLVAFILGAAWVLATAGTAVVSSAIMRFLVQRAVASALAA